MDLKGVDDMSLANLANLTGVKMPHRKLSKEEKKNAMVQSMTWFRRNNPKVEDIDDDTLESLMNIAGTRLPIPKLSPSMKEKIIKGATDWLRNNRPDISEVDDNTYIDCTGKCSGASDA